MSGELEVHLDEAALRAILHHPATAAKVRAEAEKIAAGVRRQGILVGDLADQTGSDIDIPVLVAEQADEEGSLGIYLAHPAGVAVEASYGALARAAAEQGLKPGAKPAEGL